MSDTPLTWRTLLSEATKQLAAAGVAAPDHDARALLAHHLNIPFNQLHRGTDAEPTGMAEFQALIMRRAQRVPLAHITGQRGFWSLDLHVTPDVLDPRPDTETLIEAVLENVENSQVPLRILDIGTGSGAIALSLLSELPNAQAVATDISAAALTIANQNARTNGLDKRIAFIQTSWAAGVEGSFDIIVSNPPYICSDVIGTLEQEVRDHEPHLALDGGDDGLNAYRAIIDGLPALIDQGALIAVEIGFDQAEAVAALMQEAGCADIRIRQDLGGKSRVVLGFLSS